MSKPKSTRKNAASVKPRVYFPDIILRYCPETLKPLYLKHLSFWMYGLVCGIGIIINMVILYSTVNLFPLWLANIYAILIAWFWNYLNSVGQLGKLWGLGTQPATVVTIENPNVAHIGDAKSKQISKLAISGLKRVPTRILYIGGGAVFLLIGMSIPIQMLQIAFSLSGVFLIILGMRLKSPPKVMAKK